MLNGRTSVSVIVPVCAGEEYLDELVNSAAKVRHELNSTLATSTITELILVGDSAVDGSPQLVDKLAADRQRIVPVHLSRNFGQHAARIAGILYSKGDWVVTLDDVLQRLPNRMLERLACAFQVRLTWCTPSRAPNHRVHFKTLALDLNDALLFSGV